MPTTTKRLERSTAAHPDNVAVLRREVIAFVRERGAGPPLCEDLELAVAEAMNNVVMHAYRHRLDPGELRVSVATDGDVVEIVVADDGLGVRPRDDSPGAGYGFDLMRRLADRVRIVDRSPGAEVHLRFSTP